MFNCATKGSLTNLSLTWYCSTGGWRLAEIVKKKKIEELDEIMSKALDHGNYKLYEMHFVTACTATGTTLAKVFCPYPPFLGRKRFKKRECSGPLTHFIERGTSISGEVFSKNNSISVHPKNKWGARTTVANLFPQEAGEEVLYGLQRKSRQTAKSLGMIGGLPGFPNYIHRPK